MKKYLTILLALLLCLLAACTQDDSAADTTADATVPTAAPTETTEANETTEATELLLPSWLLQEELALSYEEYFSQDRKYYSDNVANQWLVPLDDGSGYMGYCLDNFNQGLGVFPYNEYSGHSTPYWVVPDSVEFGKLEIVGVYGQWVYCTNLELDDTYLTNYYSQYHATELLRLDMLTGAREYIAQDTIITDAFICDHVLYYAQYLDGQMQIVRQYLPTGDQRIFPTGEEMVSLFALYKPESTNGPLVWSAIDPQMCVLLQEVLADQDSKYKDTEYNDNSFLWEVEELLTSNVRNPVKQLCLSIQNDTDVKAVRRVTYDLNTGMREEVSGVICQCSLVGIIHYHFDLEETPMPVPSVGQWQPLLGEKAEATGQTLSENDYTIHGGILYRESGSGYVKIYDMPVSNFRVSGAYIYALTGENTLVRMKGDGTQQMMLYTGTAVHNMGPYRGSTKLYIADGGQLLQLDLETHQYRVILTGINTKRVYINVEGDNENVIFFEMPVGHRDNCYQQYLYNYVTGEIEETFRL